ncbi:hypothetical protein K438DRAFT_2014567 [Mycena galopus ATCC 62051]|nr:hypothetical protein K438DRAFT_2014567 [Mycena galopus ATCC 62051]
MFSSKINLPLSKKNQKAPSRTMKLLLDKFKAAKAAKPISRILRALGLGKNPKTELSHGYISLEYDARPPLVPSATSVVLHPVLSPMLVSADLAPRPSPYGVSRSTKNITSRAAIPPSPAAPSNRLPALRARLLPGPNALAPSGRRVLRLRPRHRPSTSPGILPSIRPPGLRLRVRVRPTATAVTPATLSSARASGLRLRPRLRPNDTAPPTAIAPAETSSGSRLRLRIRHRPTATIKLSYSQSPPPPLTKRAATRSRIPVYVRQSTTTAAPPPAPLTNRTATRSRIPVFIRQATTTAAPVSCSLSTPKSAAVRMRPFVTKDKENTSKVGHFAQKEKKTVAPAEVRNKAAASRRPFGVVGINSSVSSSPHHPASIHGRKIYPIVRPLAENFVPSRIPRLRSELDRLHAQGKMGGGSGVSVGRGGPAGRSGDGHAGALGAEPKNLPERARKALF